MERGLRGGKRGLRRPHAILLRLRVQVGDRVARPQLMADIHVAGQHPAINAEGEVFLGPRTDMAGERDRFALRLPGGHDGPDRADFRGRRRLFVAGAQKNEAKPGQCDHGFHSGPHACSRGADGKAGDLRRSGRIIYLHECM